MEHGRRDGRHRKHSSRKQEKKAQDDDNSSLSSLGSLPEATSVVLQFNDDLPSQRRLTTHLGNTSSHTSSHSQSHQTHSQTFSRLKESRSRLTSSSSSSQHASSSSSKICPHCKKSFANAFAVPKHIAVCSIAQFSYGNSEAWLTRTAVSRMVTGK